MGIIAYPINYSGKGKYFKNFEALNIGIVFEDDGRSGYLYLTGLGFTEIYDALQIYPCLGLETLKNNDKIFLVCHEEIMRIGFYIKDKGFYAVFDILGKQAACKTGLPKKTYCGWTGSGHKWDDKLVECFNSQ